MPVRIQRQGSLDSFSSRYDKQTGHFDSRFAVQPTVIAAFSLRLAAILTFNRSPLGRFSNSPSFHFHRLNSLSRMAWHQSPRLITPTAPERNAKADDRSLQNIAVCACPPSGQSRLRRVTLHYQESYTSAGNIREKASGFDPGFQRLNNLPPLSSDG